jgi:uncharacterized repeat protein (TIGR03803 family)
MLRREIMMQGLSRILLCGAVALALSAPAVAGSLTVVHTFKGGARDGMQSTSQLTPDGVGNFYGTTQFGGSKAICSDGSEETGCGIVFRIALDGTETILHAFKGKDGAYPSSRVTLGPDGTLYGTTSIGGRSANCSGGCGTVYRITPDGQETVIHSFVSGSDGRSPMGGVAVDSKGNLYGTTLFDGPNLAGTIYKIAPDGTLTTLHAFNDDGVDGTGPSAPLVWASGNLYGSTGSGGANGAGTIFRITPHGDYSVLYGFSRFTDGGYPDSALVIDKDGNVYGTTHQGGDNDTGVVFKVTPSGTETVLHMFGSISGAYPHGVIADRKGISTA